MLVTDKKRGGGALRRISRRAYRKFLARCRWIDAKRNRCKPSFRKPWNVGISFPLEYENLFPCCFIFIVWPHVSKFVTIIRMLHLSHRGMSLWFKLHRTNRKISSSLHAILNVRKNYTLCKHFSNHFYVFTYTIIFFRRSIRDVN